MCRSQDNNKVLSSNLLGQRGKENEPWFRVSQELPDFSCRCPGVHSLDNLFTWMRSNPRFKLGRVWFCFLIFFFFRVKASRPFVSYITTVWVNNVTFSIRTKDSSVTLAFVTLMRKIVVTRLGTRACKAVWVTAAKWRKEAMIQLVERRF